MNVDMSFFYPSATTSDEKLKEYIVKQEIMTELLNQNMKMLSKMSKLLG